MNLYSIVLGLHNIVRWAVVILGILATVMAYVGWFGKREWTERDRKLGMFFTMAIDIQILLGLLLYFIFSPLTRTALQDFAAAMRVNDLRFFAVEHVFYMIVGVVFAHLGSILPRRKEDAKSKFRLAAIFFTLAILFILAGIPWSRPLFPGLR
jgi:hypothetical protein